MSKEKQKQRKNEAKKKAIKNAEREIKKMIMSPPKNYRTFAGESKDKLVSDLQNVDVTDDKKLTIGFFKVFGLPIPADLIERYDIKEDEL